MPAKKVAEHNKATEMIRAGAGSTEISAATGLCKSTVCAIAKKLGVRLPRPGCKRPVSVHHLVCNFCLNEFERRTAEVVFQRKADDLVFVCENRPYKNHKDAVSLGSLRSISGPAEKWQNLSEFPKQLSTRWLEVMDFPRKIKVPKSY